MSRYILPVAGVVALWVLYNKFFGSGSGTGSNNTSTEDTTAASIQDSLNTDKASGGFQTITNAQASSIANAVFSLGLSQSPPLDENTQSQIVWQIIQVNTLTDLLTVMSYFQTRSVNTGSFLSLCALANISCTKIEMGSFLQAVLDLSHRSQINGFLSDQNINYHF